MKEKISENRDCYYANRYHSSGELASSRLVRVLSDSEKIWSGFYGGVNKVKVLLWKKELSFAKKTFKNTTDVDNALKMYQKIRSGNLPTWNTYRHLVGTNDVLMTLGNADGSLLFSPHNESKDREKAKSEHVFEKIVNKDAFFEETFSLLVKASEQGILLPWDAYFLKVKNGEFSLIIWDFDQISLWRNPPSMQLRLEDSIKEFFGFLSSVDAYFGLDYREEFFNFLKKKQETWENMLADIDIQSLYHWCNFIREE